MSETCHSKRDGIMATASAKWVALLVLPALVLVGCNKFEKSEWEWLEVQITYDTTIECALDAVREKNNIPEEKSIEDSVSDFVDVLVDPNEHPILSGLLNSVVSGVLKESDNAESAKENAKTASALSEIGNAVSAVLGAVSDVTNASDFDEMISSIESGITNVTDAIERIDNVDDVGSLVEAFELLENWMEEHGYNSQTIGELPADIGETGNAVAQKLAEDLVDYVDRHYPYCRFSYPKYYKKINGVKTYKTHCSLDNRNYMLYYDDGWWSEPF